MKRYSLLFFGLAILLFSCAHLPIVYNAPKVVINTHDTVNAYQNGDTIRLDLNMSDDDALHGGYVYVIDTDADTAVGNQPDTLFNYDPYVQDLPLFAKDTFWILSGATALDDWFITVVATNNHVGYTEIDVPISVFP